MKRMLPALAGLCLLAGPAFSQIDYENPIVETLVTRQQILDYTSTLDPASTGIALRNLVVNSAGNLVITDRGGAQGQARIIEIDISGANPVFTTLAGEDDMAAVLETSTEIFDGDTGAPIQPRLNFGGMGHRVVGGVDHYYVHQFGQNPNNCGTCADEIIEIVAGDPVTIRRVGSLDGPGGVSVIGDELFFPLISAFSNQIDDDGIYKMDIATGVSEEIASLAQVTAVTGATNVGTQGAGMTASADGLIYFFSEEFRGGSDDFLLIDTTDGNAISILEPSTTFTPNEPGVASMAVDSNGTLFSFDQFPAGTTRRFIIREADGTLSFPDTQDILDAFGYTTPARLFLPNDSMQAVVESPESVALYAVNADGNAGAENPRIIRMTFQDPILLLVELESFTATAAHASAPVNIEWVTASEIDTVGFHVHRAEGGAVGAAVNASIIPAQGSVSSGATYSLVDPVAVGSNGTRDYFLVETETNGTTNTYGPFRASVGGTESNVVEWPTY